MFKSNPNLILVSGPCSSGKSEWAENLLNHHNSVLYVACSETIDDEDWLAKITVHKKRRPKHWKFIQSSYDLSKTLDNVNSNEAILVDSIGGFVSFFINLKEDDWLSEESKLLESIHKIESHTILVVEETGWSVVPSSKLGNVFRERLGRLSQKIQLISGESWLVINGRALNLTQISVPIK